MAITAGVCDSYTKEIMEGTHVIADVYKIALYTSAATLSAATTAYSATNEVAGTGYTAGGQTLTGFVAAVYTGVAVLDFTTDPSWAASTITTAGALIYNSSKSNKAVAVLSFGGDVSTTAGTLTVQFPVAAAATGLIRIS
jgi:hypothetical protein